MNFFETPCISLLHFTFLLFVGSLSSRFVVIEIYAAKITFTKA